MSGLRGKTRVQRAPKGRRITSVNDQSGVAWPQVPIRDDLDSIDADYDVSLGRSTTAISMSAFRRVAEQGSIPLKAA